MLILLILTSTGSSVTLSSSFCCPFLSSFFLFHLRRNSSTSADSLSSLTFLQLSFVYFSLFSLSPYLVLVPLFFLVPLLSRPIVVAPFFGSDASSIFPPFDHMDSLHLPLLSLSQLLTFKVHSPQTCSWLEVRFLGLLLPLVWCSSFCLSLVFLPFVACSLS
jgi:hypothetical protein